MNGARLALVAILTASGLVIAGCTAPPSPFAATTPGATPTRAPASPAATAPAAAEGEVKVGIFKDAFLAVGDPAKAWDRPEIRIKSGTKVVWTNGDDIAHDITFVKGPETPKSGAPGTLGSGQSWSHTFTIPGTYEYQCNIHRGLMDRPGVGPRVIVE